MRLHTLSTAVTSLLVIPLVSAFVDTSPFFIFSTVDLPSNIAEQRSQHISTAGFFSDNAKRIIETCDADAVVIVLQPGVHASDFLPHDSAPELRRRIEKRDQQVLRIDHGVGSVDVDMLKDTAVKACGAHVVSVDASTSTFEIVENNMRPSLIPVDFPKLPTDSVARARVLLNHDIFLTGLLSTLSTEKFIVIYVTTPVDNAEAIRGRPEVGAAHTGSYAHPSVPVVEKRDFQIQATNRTRASYGSVFSRYQFFSPGIFLALMAILIMLIVAMVGFGAVSSITVSYGAFEKEMGPAQQKKKH